MANQGLAAQFFFRDTATGTVDLEDPVAERPSELLGAGDNPLPENPGPGNTISGIWRGLIEAPEAGFYNMMVEADAAANATLSSTGKP